MDLSREVRSRPEREVPMETRVAEMTPVSSGRLLAQAGGGVGTDEGLWRVLTAEEEPADAGGEGEHPDEDARRTLL